MLDRIDLDRYWRFALPFAVTGLVASLAWAVAVAIVEVPDATVAIDIVLFFGIFPVHLGAILTERRLDGDHDRRRDRSVVSWAGYSLVGGVLFAAAIQWRHLWAGPYNDTVPLLIVASFYGGGVSAGRRYRRSAPERTGAATPLVGPPTVPPSLPAGPPYLVAGPLTAPPPGPDGPWAMPVALPRPPRPLVELRGCLLSLFPALVGAGVLFVFLARGAGTDAIVGPDDRPFYVATVVRGARLEMAGPPGEPTDPPAAVRAAACRNYRDFLEDRSLGIELAIVDDPGLLRSAELLDGPWADDPVAVDAETFLAQEGSLAGARARMADEEWPAADIAHADRYLTAREQPPTAGAADRYVVYTTSETTSRRLLVRLAVDPDAEGFTKPCFNRVGDIEVRMPDGSVAVVDDSLCWR